MKVDILTLFPAMLEAPINESILKRAQQKQYLDCHIHNLRQWTYDKHKKADDRPFGGGPGMVMKPEPIFEAIDALKPDPECRVILTSPRGKLFKQSDAIELSLVKRLIFISGHYEGIDERVRNELCTDVYSIGDFVLTGGELAVLVILDAVVRLIPGVVGKAESVLQDSFMDGLLDCPHYTRPPVYRGLSVPEVLLSGNHKNINQWRRKQSLKWTQKVRPDLLEGMPLSKEDLQLLNQED